MHFHKVAVTLNFSQDSIKFRERVFLKK